MIERVGIRELRQQASELVRRAEAGEEIVITVAGRPTVRLCALPARRWRRGREIAHLFQAPTDPNWPRERRDDDVLDTGLRDPWQ